MRILHWLKIAFLLVPRSLFRWLILGVKSYPLYVHFKSGKTLYMGRMLSYNIKVDGGTKITNLKWVHTPLSAVTSNSDTVHLDLSEVESVTTHHHRKV